MKLRHLWQAAAMLMVSTLFLVLLLCLGVLSFAYVSFRQEKSQSVSAAQISTTLTEQDGVYQFSGAKILAEHDLWAMLINEDGEVCWSYALPADVDTTYTLTDVTSFTRWYLKDYPVQCHIRSDGLLVVGWPKDSLWKYGISAPLLNYGLRQPIGRG